MASFLIYYSSTYNARGPGLPRNGTRVEIETLADLDELAASLGRADLIVRQPSSKHHRPEWADFYDTFDAEDHVDYYVEVLPDGWEEMRWIEVLNDTPA